MIICYFILQYYPPGGGVAMILPGSGVAMILPGSGVTMILPGSGVAMILPASGVAMILMHVFSYACLHAHDIDLSKTVCIFDEGDPPCLKQLPPLMHFLCNVTHMCYSPCPKYCLSCVLS